MPPFLMRGFFDIAALSRVLRKAAPRRPASAATGDFLAPGRRSKSSIRLCLVSPVPTLSPRSFSFFLSFDIIGSRVGREEFPLSRWTPFYRFFLLGDLGGNGVFSFFGPSSRISRKRRKRINTHSRKFFP